MKYHTLYLKLLKEIEEKIYEPGTKLPTEQQISDWGYSRNTVRQALAMLEEEGLILKRKGSGSIVKPISSEKKKNGNIAVIFISFRAYTMPETLTGITESMRGWASPILYATEGLIEEEERILEELKEKDIDAIIVEGFSTVLPNPNAATYQEFIDSGIPVLFLYCGYPAVKRSYYVVNDDREGGKEATYHLHSIGCKKIGGLFVLDTLQSHFRYEGYLDACKELGMKIQSESILWIQASAFTNPLEVQTKIIETLKNCDGVICSNDWFAQLAIDGLLQNNVNVPDDVAVISFDNLSLCETAGVPITSMDCDPYKLGKVAAEKIKDLLADRKISSEKIPWILIKRKSS